VGGIIFRPLTLEHLPKLGLDPHKAGKLALELHAHSIQYAYKLVSTRRRALTTHNTIIKKVALLGTLLTLIELSSFLLWWGGHGAQALGVFLSLIDVGSASLPT